MPIDPRTPTTTSQEKLIQQIADLNRRIAQLERTVQRLIEAVGL